MRQWSASVPRPAASAGVMTAAHAPCNGYDGLSLTADRNDQRIHSGAVNAVEHPLSVHQHVTGMGVGFD
ncbi:hypothetical protein D8780_15045 [Notoacmeibacter ruber]|uniref:Uncharacterized protein n=1 Tax=Notoacmeibacter ruber TaxID=2670375 RepID=A0A3L7J463_9HYPH|nr:hypothetical protein D8780_15045 [Notoacmeibacter ruber]